MGKSFAAATTKLAKNLRPSKHSKPASRVQRSGEGDKSKKMEGTSSVLNNSNNSSSGGSGSGSSVTRLPLSEVVSDCVKRWFKDTLKEAKAGDINMQVLLGQMYYSGYGVPRDVQKGSVWMTRASRTRSSVWKVSDKHPGYNASDSDSDEIKAE